jgi:3-isopropylmalate dehydrogenase
MMLRYGLNQPLAAAALEKAVEKVLEFGYRTGDIFSEGMTLVGCQAMGQAILKVLES